jgi:cephalosporin hydroxylase
MRNIILLLTFVFVSCSNKPTLQKYFVENSESSEFFAIDIAPSILKTDALTLTSEETAALDAFKKMNILAFKKDSINDNKYKSEMSKVKTILKDEQYESLIKYGSNTNGAAIYFAGETDKIDEFVLVANQTETGFVIVRILGDDMDVNHVMTLFQLLQKSNVDMEQLKPLQQFMK